MKRWTLGMVVMAALAWLLLPWLVQANQLMRIRALMGLVSIGVFLITLLAIRSYKLREKYAILWLTTAGMIILVALFPHLVDVTREWFGMQYVTSLVAVIFVFLVLVSFHFSIALSALNDKVAAIASRTAMLEARLRALERHENTPPARPKEPAHECPAAGG